MRTGSVGIPMALAQISGAGAAALWASHVLIGWHFAERISPAEFVFWRWALAAVFMLLVFSRGLRADLPKLLGAWPVMLGLAALGSVGSNGLGYWALHHTSATSVAIVSSSMPAMVYGLNVLIFGARANRWAVLGVALSTAGVLLLHLQDRAIASSGGPVVGGVLFAALSNLCWALYSVLTARHRPDVSQRSFTTALALCAVIVSSPLLLVQVVAGSTMLFDAANVAALLHAGISVSVFGYLLYNVAIAHLGSRAAALFMHLIPFMTVLFTVIIDRTLPSASQAAGLALILAGVALVMRMETAGA